jgi:hypothetical protein
MRRLSDGAHRKESDGGIAPKVLSRGANVLTGAHAPKSSLQIGSAVHSCGCYRYYRYYGYSIEYCPNTALRAH